MRCVSFRTLNTAAVPRVVLSRDCISHVPRLTQLLVFSQQVWQGEDLHHRHEDEIQFPEQVLRAIEIDHLAVFNFMLGILQKVQAYYCFLNREDDLFICHCGSAVLLSLEELLPSSVAIMNLYRSIPTAFNPISRILLSFDDKKL
jgi:hypothetical protein